MGITTKRQGYLKTKSGNIFALASLRDEAKVLNSNGSSNRRISCCIVGRSVKADKVVPSIKQLWTTRHISKDISVQRLGRSAVQDRNASYLIRIQVRLRGFIARSESTRCFIQRNDHIEPIFHKGDFILEENLLARTLDSEDISPKNAAQTGIRTAAKIVRAAAAT